ncbi:MAG TPA: acyl-CoA dehydrogenase family protein [Acidimicrobiales bacterium]|jgi:acyl-CoA dehydrogenase|nr:acyl-CoA dehydrogenase family protein [Acidimicrobiales bacterium]
MSWDFSTDPEYQKLLDWADGFVRDEVEPLDLAFPDRHFERPDPRLHAVIDPLKQQVRDRGLWATHLDPELGGQGHGQLKLALLNEILGRSNWAPVIFGTQAPDTGNAEILARFGTSEQKARFLQPLLDGDIFSSYSMTEPHGGADPKGFTTRARRDGEQWVIDGEKYFSSNARYAEFLIVMAVTDPDVSPYQGMSMFLVPTDTPGIEIVRNVGTMWEPMDDGDHAWIRYHEVRIPADHLLGEEGRGFAVAQARLGGGRIHHAMRTVARCRQAFDMMCERALSRETQGSLLGDKQLVQEAIAESWAQITQFRLMVLYTAWLIDQNTTQGVRKEIAACKFEAARILVDVVYRAMHVHGALGVSNELPLARMWMYAPQMGVTDGPTEVHKITLARQVLKDYTPAPGPFPTQWLPPRIEEARARYASALEHHLGNS